MGRSEYVYLDHQASTPLLAEAAEAMRPYWSEWFASPSSQHQMGLRARDALEAARGHAAALLNAESPDEILFTSGGTESANLAIKGTARAARGKRGHIVCSRIEHPSVLNSILFLVEQGFSFTEVACDPEGLVDPADVRKALKPETILVSVHLANHDVGAIQPIAEIARITRERGIPLFCDAAACGGWIPIDARSLGAQLISITPHRFYGPKGVGILYRHRQARLEPLVHGGKQESGKRAGTENVPAIVGAGVACQAAARDLEMRRAHVSKLQKKLAEELLKIPKSRLNGPKPGPKRLAHNVNLSFEGLEGESLLLLCDMQGIGIGSGPSCVSQNLKRPYVLEALQLSEAQSRGNVMMTLGKDNSEADLDYVLATLPGLVEKLRLMSPSWKP